jgi:serine/threonine protein kinase
MLAGRGPFDHIQNEAMLLSAHAVENPKPPSHFSKEPIPAELDRALLRVLRKDPDERFQTADALREELEQIVTLLERSPGLLETSVFAASSFGVPPSVTVPRSGAFPIKASASEQGQPERPVTKLDVILLFVSALLVTASTTAALITLLRGAR